MNKRYDAHALWIGFNDDGVMLYTSHVHRNSIFRVEFDANIDRVPRSFQQ